MITGNYSLVADPNWASVQFQDVFLELDSTAAAVNLTLPAISTLNRFWNVRLHIFWTAGANACTIRVGAAGDRINGNTSYNSLAAIGDNLILGVGDETNWLIESLYIGS